MHGFSSGFVYRTQVYRGSLSCICEKTEMKLRKQGSTVLGQEVERGPNAGDVPRHSGKGEPDAEGAAFARRTFSSDATTQLFDQGLCDRKS